MSKVQSKITVWGLAALLLLAGCARKTPPEAFEAGDRAKVVNGTKSAPVTKKKPAKVEPLRPLPAPSRSQAPRARAVESPLRSRATAVAITSESVTVKVVCVDVPDYTTGDLWVCLADSLTLRAHDRLQRLLSEGFVGPWDSDLDSLAMTHFHQVAVHRSTLFLSEIPDSIPEEPGPSFVTKVVQGVLSLPGRLWSGVTSLFSGESAQVQSAPEDTLGTATSRAVYVRMLRGPTLTAALRFRRALLTPTLNPDSTFTPQWPPIMGRFVPRVVPQLTDGYVVGSPQVFLWGYVDTGDSAHAAIDTVEVPTGFVNPMTKTPCFKVGGCDSTVMN